MARSYRLTPLAYGAILINAVLYLTVLWKSIAEFIARHDPRWEFFECVGCRQPEVSFLTWTLMAIGISSLFLRRSCSPYATLGVNLILLVCVILGPVAIHAQMIGGAIFDPGLSGFWSWTVLLTGWTLLGSILLGSRSVRRGLAGEVHA